jgi:hypothetical protein
MSDCVGWNVRLCGLDRQTAYVGKSDCIGWKVRLCGLECQTVWVGMSAVWVGSSDCVGSKVRLCGLINQTGLDNHVWVESQTGGQVNCPYNLNSPIIHYLNRP